MVQDYSDSSLYVSILNALQDLEDSQPYPLGSRAAENADEVPANENEEEPQDIELFVADKVSLQSLISDTC